VISNPNITVVVENLKDLEELDRLETCKMCNGGFDSEGMILKKKKS
jgi:hypothetical protein